MRGQDRVIFKYVLPVDATVILELPAGAIVRHFGAQGDGLYIWVEVDSLKRPVRRSFAIIPTGEGVPDDGEYVGTALMHDGALVWHLYEVPA